MQGGCGVSAACLSLGSEDGHKPKGLRGERKPWLFLPTTLQWNRVPRERKPPQEMPTEMNLSLGSESPTAPYFLRLNF